MLGELVLSSIFRLLLENPKGSWAGSSDFLSEGGCIRKLQSVAFVLDTELFELLELFDEFIGLNAEKFGVWDFISEGGLFRVCRLLHLFWLQSYLNY